MNIEPLNTFDILSMLDVLVLLADQVRRYIDISIMVCNTNPTWIQDNGHWVAMDFTKEWGYLFDSFGRPHRILDSNILLIKTGLQGCTMTLICNHQSPMHVDITRLYFVCRE